MTNSGWRLSDITRSAKVFETQPGSDNLRAVPAFVRP